MAKILAIDDDPHVLNLLKLTFQGSGHDIECVGRAHEVVPLIEREALDAIILDLMLPDLSGWELLSALREHPKTRLIPILVLSALAEVHDRVRGIRSGADDYMIKPFHPEELLARIESLVSREERHRKGLYGRIEIQPLADLLQTFEQNARSGLLEVVAPPFSGVLVLRQGRLETADFAGLEASEAVLALLELRAGSFRFTPSVSPLRPGQEEPPAQPFQPLLMEAAWIADELEHRRRHLPEVDASLVPVAGAVPDVPTEMAALPIVDVAAALTEQPGLSTVELLRRKVASPDKVRLALSWLFEHGLVRATRTVAH